jgi:hypothetical protein
MSHFTPKKEMGFALYRKLDSTHAKSIVADRLLYTDCSTHRERMNEMN